MKAIHLFLSFWLCTAFIAEAQNPTTIELTLNKTTNVVFDYPIIQVDRGSADVLAQLVSGTKNAIQLKAGRENFEETNLSVYTADGQVYELTLQYGMRPKQRVYLIHQAYPVEPVALTGVNLLAIEKLSQKMLLHSGRGKITGDNRHNMEVRLNNIGIQDDILFFHLQIINHSSIRYDIASLRFFIKDITSARRTVVQERALTPVYTFNDAQAVRTGQKLDIIFACRKFTIPDRKKLMITLREENGGRNFILKVSNAELIRAQML